MHHTPLRLYPAVIVHGLADLSDALAPGRPLTPLSAPGAALYGGCGWWAALLREAGFTGMALLDCADAAGRALEAIKLGLPGVVVACDERRFALLAGIAAEAGALLLPAAPPALDLARRGARRQLASWLDDNG